MLFFHIINHLMPVYDGLNVRQLLMTSSLSQLTHSTLMAVCFPVQLQHSACQTQEPFLTWTMTKSRVPCTVHWAVKKKFPSINQTKLRPKAIIYPAFSSQAQRPINQCPIVSHIYSVTVLFLLRGYRVIKLAKQFSFIKAQHIKFNPHQPSSLIKRPTE